MISYKPLWETMREKNITTYQLLQQGMDKHTLQNLRTDKNITMFTAEKLCNILNCNVSDIVEFIKDDE